MKVTLIGDRILVEADETEKKTASGVIVTSSSEPSDVKIGTVVVTGPGKPIESGDGLSYINMKVQIGDKIMFQYGQKVMIEGKPYVLVSESSEVLMILNR